MTWSPSSGRHLVLGGVAMLVLGCVSPPPTAPQPAPAASASAATLATPSSPGLRFDVRALDTHADPCVDFYDYACGGWRASHPVPPDQTRWSRYSEMTAVNFERTRQIVEEASRAGPNASPAEKRVGAYYRACLDEVGIEARGLAPIRGMLAAISSIRTREDAIAVLAELQRHAIAPVFEVSAEVNPRDTKQVVLWIDKAPFGLPDAGDYTKRDDAAVARRARYVAHLERLFRLLGSSPDDAARSAGRLLAFETTLASTALTAVERRNQDAQIHLMTIAELNQRFAMVDWSAYFRQLGAPAVDLVNVAQPAFMDATSSAFLAGDLGGLRDYLQMRVTRALASVLPGPIEEEFFDFRQRFLRGAKQMEPRWKRCLKDVNSDIGDDVGRIFMARYFNDDARARVGTMVDSLRETFRTELASTGWLGAPAREAAIAKLARGLVVVGASNRPRSFDGLRVEADDPFGNAWRAQAQYFQEKMAKVGRPTDREAFFQPLPQQLDAFGSKTKNATGFTAGFLQPPVFDQGMDDAVNYGGLGSVIGHEMSHQFDDEGRKYDADGNLRSWWSPEDVTRFEQRAACFVDEYSRFHLDDGTALDGKLTLGENIADNGGIRLSYRALRPSESGPRIDGFTPAQRFFLAWGQIRCENVTPETARRQAETDPHAAGRWRVNGVVSNMPEFASAFSCKAAAPMAPEKRCVVW